MVKGNESQGTEKVVQITKRKGAPDQVRVYRVPRVKVK